MSTIIEAIKSTFTGTNDKTNDEETVNIEKSYGSDLSNDDKYYVLFGLNGYLGISNAGSHRAIIVLQAPSILKIVFIDQHNTERLDSVSIDLDLLASISILSKYHTTKHHNNKLIGFAARTSEIVLSFSTNISVTSNVLWIWTPNLQQRNLLIQDIDTAYTNLKGRPPNIEQVKMKDIVQRHKFITSINSPRTPKEKKKLQMYESRRMISCKICHAKVPINKLKDHKCVAKEYIKCSLCNSNIPVEFVDKHCNECIDMKVLVVMIEQQQKLEEVELKESIDEEILHHADEKGDKYTNKVEEEEEEDIFDQYYQPDIDHIKHRSPKHQEDVFV